MAVLKCGISSVLSYKVNAVTENPSRYGQTPTLLGATTIHSVPELLLNDEYADNA